MSVGRIGPRRALATLAAGLLLVLGILLDAGEPTHDRGLPAALRHEAIRRIEALPLLSGMSVAEIDCRAPAAGRLACPALLETRGGSGRVVYYLGRGRGELMVESIKLTRASAQLIRASR